MGEAFQFTLKAVQMKPAAEITQKLGIEVGGRVQQFIDSEVIRRCQQYAPMDSGELIRSGIRETRIGSGEVVYRTPYARRWYYCPAQFDGAPKRGNYWFEQMKNEGGKDAILRGVKRVAGAK